jgi:hypothetical protein
MFGGIVMDPQSIVYSFTGSTLAAGPVRFEHAAAILKRAKKRIRGIMMIS